MKWGLTQGLWGAKRASLAPLPSALGPNIYLSQMDFLKMLGLALALHALAFGIAAILPRDTVTDIPVRALTFKLGGANPVAADRPKMAAVEPIAKPAPPEKQAIPSPVMKAESVEAKPKKPLPAPLKPIVQPKVVKVDEELKELPTYQPAPAIAPTPQQYVREVGAAPSTAPETTNVDAALTEQAVQAIRTRYEQEISAWIQRHKFYPVDASGREGRAIVRVRIDRAGNVRYYAIEQSAGLQALDNAALDMIRRANPVPAVPSNYPAGNLVEFLIPISFKAPQ